VRARAVAGIKKTVLWHSYLCNTIVRPFISLLWSRAAWGKKRLSLFMYVHGITWDYKNALGRPLNDNIESWKVSHFEAKDHTFQTRGVRF
jgi:hypothetical protein